MKSAGDSWNVTTVPSSVSSVPPVMFSSLVNCSLTNRDWSLRPDGLNEDESMVSENSSEMVPWTKFISVNAVSCGDTRSAV